MIVKVGDLVILWSGDYGTIVRGPYPFRSVRSQVDRDLADGGLGHLAGSYGSAVDIVNHATGEKIRHSLSSNGFRVITSEEATPVAKA